MPCEARRLTQGQDAAAPNPTSVSFLNRLTYATRWSAIVYRPSSASSESAASPLPARRSAEPRACSNWSAPAGATSALMTCPPSKPISMRTRSVGRRNHLRQDPVDRIRMDEGDLEAEESFARLLVDQIGAGACETRDRLLHVRDFVGDVVHSRPALGDEAADGRIFGERLEQLHASTSDADGSSLDALVRDGGAVFDLRAEQSLVGRERGVEILHGDAEMVNARRVHPRDAIEVHARGRACSREPTTPARWLQPIAEMRTRRSRKRAETHTRDRSVDRRSEDARRAHGLRRARFRLHVREQREDLLAYERLFLE